MADPYIVASPGARRLIVYETCKLYGDDIEIDGQKVSETSITVYFRELAPDRPPWPEEPWKMGVLWRFSTLNLFVPPGAFQPLWEIAEAPESEQFDVRINCQVHPDVLYVYEVSFRGVRPPTHPVVFEVKKLGQMLGRVVPVLGWFFAGAILVGSLLQWFSRYLW